jgi:DNA polymerase-3 subunit chi
MPPSIDFYILSSHAESERLRFVCKLTEKIYRSGLAAYIVTESDQQSQRLDNLLWSFRAGSFIPHQRYSGTEISPDNSILLGTLPAPEPWHKIIINLSPQLLSTPTSDQRLVEVLDASEALKQAGRERYKQYQQAGHAIQVHHL